jgi:hypothetical protein
MPRKLLLLADDRCWNELRGGAGLPERVWINRADRWVRGSFDETDDRIIRHDPALIAPRGVATLSSDSPAAIDDEGRDELFAELLDSVVCHLVVLDHPPDGLLEPATTTIPCPGGLAELAQWYERFHAEAARRVAHRQAESRHIVILVFAEPPAADAFEPLQKLTAGAGRNKLCDACYVLWPQLELGPHDICHSRYVWPIAVGRLLLRLLEEPVVQPDDRTRAWAWRAFELAPALDPDEVDRNYRELLDDAYRGLRREIHSDELRWNTAQFNPLPLSVDPVPLPPAKPISPGEFWHTFDAVRAVQQAASPTRFEAELQAAGAEFSTRLKRRAVLDEPPAWTEVQKVWSAVHTHPGYVSAALADTRVAGAGLAQDPALQLTQSWKDIAAREAERDQRIGEARACAALLAEAQSNYVELLFRLVAAGAVAVLMGFLSLLLFLELLGSWLTAALVALGAGGGAAAAAFALHMSERFRGEAARHALLDMLREIDDSSRQRHQCCQEAVVRASTFWERLRARSAATRLRQLLARAQTMLDRELRPEFVEPSEADSPEVPHDDAASGPQRAERRRRQRERFLAQTSLRHAIDPRELAPDNLRELVGIEQLIRDRQTAFLSEVWRRTCIEADPSRLGKIPAQLLVPRIREFHTAFRTALVAEVHRQVIERMHGRGADLWAAEIARLRNQPFLYYMSCPIGSATPHLLSRLFLRADFRTDPLARELGELPVVASTRLQGLPLVGLLVEECPIRFQIVDGRIAVQADATA